MNKILEAFMEAIACLCEETGLQSHRPYAHTTSNPDTIRSAAEELIKSEQDRIVKLLKKIPRYAHWKTHGENRPSTACSACGFDDGFDDALTQALSEVLKEIEE